MTRVNGIYAIVGVSTILFLGCGKESPIPLTTSFENSPEVLTYPTPWTDPVRPPTQPASETYLREPNTPPSIQDDFTHPAPTLDSMNTLARNGGQDTTYETQDMCNTWTVGNNLWGFTGSSQTTSSWKYVVANVFSWSRHFYDGGPPMDCCTISYIDAYAWLWVDWVQFASGADWGYNDCSAGLWDSWALPDTEPTHFWGQLSDHCFDRRLASPIVCD